MEEVQVQILKRTLEEVGRRLRDRLPPCHGLEKDCLACEVTRMIDNGLEAAHLVGRVVRE